MKQYFNSFFSNKTNQITLLASTISVAAILLFTNTTKPYKIYPDNNTIEYSFFTDSANSGSSIVYNTLISDSHIQFDYHLKKGFLNPYVGLHIKQKNGDGFDFKSNNQMVLDIYTEGSDNIGLYINTINKIDRKEQIEEEISFYYSIKVKNGRNSYKINLNKLIVPDWFKQSKGFNQDFQLNPNKHKVSLINITTDYPSKVEDIGKIKLYSLSVKRNNKLISSIAFIALCIVVILLLALHSIKLKLASKTNKVTITYKPIEASKTKATDKAYLNFINTNFNNPELSLEMVSKQTDIGQRNIANAIQENFGCNFKTYINQIRINESKRLLKESDLNIGEIAFKVGFNNQSHFNRVFKSITKQSPGSYRS